MTKSLRYTSISETDKTRWFARGLVAVFALTAVIGFFLRMDLTPLESYFTAAVLFNGIGEGSNLGKRFTFKKEAVDAVVHDA